MFNLGFWELALIGVIALLVVGPDKLPRLAHSAGLWLGKARAMANSLRAEIEREVNLEEARKFEREQRAMLEGLAKGRTATTSPHSQARRRDPADDTSPPGADAEPTAGVAPQPEPETADEQQQRPAS